MKLDKPRGATHARIVTPNKTKSLVNVKDLDCLQGVGGKIVWLKDTRDGFKELGESEFDGEYEGN